MLFEVCDNEKCILEQATGYEYVEKIEHKDYFHIVKLFLYINVWDLSIYDLQFIYNFYCLSECRAFFKNLLKIS